MGPSAGRRGRSAFRPPRRCHDGTHQHRSHPRDSHSNLRCTSRHRTNRRRDRRNAAHPIGQPARLKQANRLGRFLEARSITSSAEDFSSPGHSGLAACSAVYRARRSGATCRRRCGGAVSGLPGCSALRGQPRARERQAAGTGPWGWPGRPVPLPSAFNVRGLFSPPVPTAPIPPLR